MMKYVFIGLVAVGLGLFALNALSVVDPVLAQSAQQSACEGSGGRWVGGECRGAAGEPTIGGVVQSVVNILLFIIGAVAVVMLIVGGFRYVVSGGDSNAVQGAKNTILYAIVGIVVAFLAWAAVEFVVDQLSQGNIT